MFIRTFLLRITHTIISQSIADSSWITLYKINSPRIIHIQGVPKKCTHILRDVIYVLLFELNWIMVAMCRRTFAQKMALIKWMLASPCDRQDSQRKCAAIHVDTLVNVAQAVVRRNQKCLDADGNHFEHLLQFHKSNVTFCYRYIAYYHFNTVFFPILKCVHVFFGTPCIYSQQI